MLLSKELLKGVFKEVRHFPIHAYKVVKSKWKNSGITFTKYAYGKHRKQYFCWFEPSQNTQDKIIVFYHGGAWTFGTPELLNERAALFLERGYTVIMPSHRKLPMSNFKHIREDLVLTLRKISEVRKERGVINKKILLGGMSSGANLAALILFDQGLYSETGLSSSDVIGAFLCAAPVNLAGMTASFLLARYAGKKGSKNFEQASPINHLPISFSKPVLVVHGTEDGLVKYESSAAFVKALEKVSTIPVVFHSIKNGSHIDAVSWAYEDNGVRRVILTWLEQLGEG